MEFFKKHQIIIVSIGLALAMIGGALYLRFIADSNNEGSTSQTQPSSKDNSTNVTQPPVTETPPVGESPVAPTPTPTNEMAP